MVSAASNPTTSANGRAVIPGLVSQVGVNSDGRATA
jgi:hypothetical protein